MSVTAKSVIFDIADNHGGLSFGLMGVRRIEFILNSNVITLGAQDFAAYATSNYDSRFLASNAFLSSLSKTGSWNNTTWMTPFIQVNQRLIVVFANAIAFDQIVVNNLHHTGNYVDNGVNTVKITISTDTITNTTYNATISNSTVLFNNTIAAHVAMDVSDPVVVWKVVTAALVAVCSQPFFYTDQYRCLLNQPYWLWNTFVGICEQVYGLRLLTAIIQYYGDTPTFRRLLAQYYGSALVLRRICNHPYDDYLKFISAIDQEWSFPEFLRRILQQKYSISGSHLARIMDEQYNLSQYQLLRTLLDQVFVLPPSETLVQTPSVFVTADDILIDPHHVSIEIDEANFSIRGEIHLASEDDFLRCKHMQTTISITIDATEFVMLPDSPRRSRSELGHTEYYVPVVSPTVLLDAPNAEPITQAFSGSMASTIAADMANLASISLDWQLLDWYIPSATLYANNETPLAIIRKIVAAVGGILQTSPEGLLICRPEYPLTLPDWPTATPDFYLTDMDNFFSVDSTPVIREGYNRYLVSNQDAATAGLTLESTDITATSKKIRVYQVPWNEAATINLQTSGGDWVSIIADGIHTEEITDQVEIIAGSGRTSKPFYGMLLSAYLQDSLGTITVSEDGQITTEDSGNSLLHLTYTTRYHQFTVTDSHIEDVQFYPEEVEI